MKLWDEKNWKVWTDREGVLFSFPKKCPLGSREVSRKEEDNERAALLQLIAEQCESKEIRNGIHLEWAAVCQLPPQARESLSLPDEWPGSFGVDYKGLTHQPDFNMRLSLCQPNGEKQEGVQIEGGVFKIGQQSYLADFRQYQLLKVFEDFDAAREGGLSHFESLSAIYKLQDLSKEGLDIDLTAFDELEILKPDAVRVAVEQKGDGSIMITPDLCQKDGAAQGAKSVVDPKELDTRIEGHVSDDKTTACVPVGKKLVLLDEKAIAGIKEITSNSHIPAAQVAEFLKQPTAWLSAEFVDLDLGFSERVQGAAPLRMAYFGETDQTGIQWIEPKEEPDKDPKEASRDEPASERGSEAEGEYKEPEEPNVLDIELQDEGEASEDQLNVRVPEESLRSDEQVDVSALKREPYAHQDEAIRWLLALSSDADRDPNWAGALLADDMGLGKTLTVLTFMREYLTRGGNEEPALVVAPVSLLEVWKQEIQKTFKETPFSEVIILHSSADLDRFKVDGAGREVMGAEPEANAVGAMDSEDLNSGIRYALRIASSDDVDHSPNKLGRVRSLIITNYETVRDYQFSLARIPWSLAVFDEAQAVKNPNAMVTRAIKALNAAFSVVMTGTPVENSLKDFWCLMDRVQSGYLNNYQPFRKEYMTPIVSARKTGSAEQVAEIRAEVGLKLRNRVAGFMLRRMKEDHLDGLPIKEVILHNEPGLPESGYDDRILCEMPKAQQEIYDQIANIETDDSQDATQRGQAVLAAIQHLKQASLHPDLVMCDNMPLPRSKKEAKLAIESSGKLVRMIQILEQIRDKEEKVLIFVINKSLQMFLQFALKEYFDLQARPSVINGDTKVKKSRSGATESRTGIIDEFQAPPGFGVLILSPIAAGVGLTITGANHVIHLERHWNPAKEAQATDRVYRIGQERPVSVWVPVLKHPTHESFDEKLDRLLAMKSGLSKSVVAPESVEVTELEGLVQSGKAETETVIQLKELHRLKADLFEAFVALLLEEECDGQVILTQRQGDKGCDIAVIDWRGDNWLIQCKHKQNPKGRVGGKAVREVAGSRAYYEDKLGKKFKKIAVFANVTKYDSSTREAARLENAVLFKFSDIKSLYPRRGFSLRQVLQRNEKTEKV